AAATRRAARAALRRLVHGGGRLAGEERVPLRAGGPVKTALALVLLLAATPAGAKLKLAVLDVHATGTVSKERVEGLSALIATEVARTGVGDVLSGADLRAMLG